MGGGAKGTSPIDDLRESLEMAAADRPSDTKRAANRSKTATDLWSVTPVVGNAMSAEDAVDAYGEALKAAKGGDVKGAAVNTGLGALNTLGAVTGLPWGKAAGRAAKAGKDSANVFVPAGRSDPVVRIAEDMREGGADNRRVWEETGRFFDPSGKLMKEIPDAGMRLKLEGRKAGDELRLNDIVEHPELFEARPQMRDIPVRLTGDVGSKGEPVMRTTPRGDFEVSLAAGDLRGGLAKNMQYDIAKTEGLPRAFRHRDDDIRKDMSFAIDQMSKVDTSDRMTREALAKYLDTVAGTRNDYVQSVSLADPKKVPNIGGALSNRNAGNVNSTVVAGRAMADDPALMATLYPYSQRASYRHRSKAGPVFENILTLPAVNSTPQQLEDFLLDWRMFGSGRPPVESSRDPWLKLRDRLRKQTP